MPEENSFPKKGDIIFADGKDWIYNACLFPGNPEGYRTGFKIAADIIAEKIAKDTKDIDRIIYPLVFLYRHYIELSIKDTIIYSKEYFGEKVDYKKISNHTLGELWSKAKILLKEVEEDYLTEEMDEAIIHYINTFSEMDPGSFSFRYPRTKEGEIALKKENINIRILYEAMQKMEIFFECLILDLVEKRRNNAEVYE